MEVSLMQEIPYQNGMNLGLGYNSLKSSGLVSSALDNVNLLRSVVQSKGQKVSFSVEMLSNSLSLTEQLGVSASASISGLAGSGSAKMSLIKSLKQNSYSVYVLVKVHVQNEQILLDLTQIKMSDKAQLLYATDAHDFFDQYGTHFIYGIISGGEFYGILEIESKSAEEYRSIKAELSGKGMIGVINASASTSFEEALNKLTSSYKIKATVIRDGGEGALQPISPDSLIKEAVNFPASVLNDKAVPFSVLVIPYTEIPHPDVDEVPIAERQDCLNKIARIYERFMRIKNDLQYALDNPELFPGLDITKIQEQIEKVSDQLDKLQVQATKSLTDHSVCDNIEFDDDLLVNVLPNQVTPSPLGFTWFHKDGGWNAIWRRDGESNFFDCHAQSNDKDIADVKYRTEVFISGEDVIIFRRWSDDDVRISSRGKLIDNGTRVKGEGGWEAIIDQRRL
jgi:hypothetical protein